MAPKVEWSGVSGTKYSYWAYPIGTTLQEAAGNYIFARETVTGRWVACYVGQTENLNQRLGDHEKEACAKRNGATQIHAHLTTGGEAVRKREEEDLIKGHKPPCNVQLK